ncbi:lysozyme inhibitor LprI family protein [Sporosarcina sp. FSL W8-0480]|uniref:lysozyme inhibitor LprI family protein n=1 Tax=Sporosarcina sp. FSL W8-0480 TaxID=2954701 RepID=UPI0030DC41D9
MKKRTALGVTSIMVLLLFAMSACSISDDSPQSIKALSDNNTLTATASQTKEDEVQEDHSTKTELLDRLDNIQKELDALPEKQDSDKGVTNAMKSYYGVSYERYDEALNEIYALLKKSLPTKTMNELKTKQIQWIKQKENAAEEERKKYEGGTFEYVAYYISLYESTKNRCYELVNEYMTD